MLAVACRPSYQPRRAAQTPLYRVVSDHLERFINVYEDRYAERYGEWRQVVEQSLRRFLECGILACGFLRVACQDCKAEYLVPFSCKGRGLCPSCGQRRCQEFSDFLHQEVLEEVPYSHMVFTIPKLLRPTFLRERRLLRLLSQCAWNTVRLGLQTALDRSVVPGAVVSVATAGDLTNPHPHLHCIVSAGGWRASGEFVPWPSWLSAERLTELFRRQVLAMLVREERLSETTQDMLLSWEHSGFSVFVGDPVAPDQVESRERLARYVVKPAVALDRLSYTPETCRVTVHSSKRGEQRELTALDFMADLAVHVPDHGEHTVLYYGRASNRARGERKKAVAQSPPPEGELPAVSPAPAPPRGRKAFRLAWAALLKRVWHIDALRCHVCDGAMRILAAIENPKTVVRILQHLGLSTQPRAPDLHRCEDRDPAVAARHPLFHPVRPEAEHSEGESDDTAATSGDEWPATDPDYEWPMDEPHPED